MHREGGETKTKVQKSYSAYANRIAHRVVTHVRDHCDRCQRDVLSIYRYADVCNKTQYIHRSLRSYLAMRIANARRAFEKERKREEERWRKGDRASEQDR